jgi:hypothetical protein
VVIASTTRGFAVPGGNTPRSGQTAVRLQGVLKPSQSG